MPSRSLGPRGHQPAPHPPGEGLILGEQGMPYDDFGELKTNPNPCLSCLHPAWGGAFAGHDKPSTVQGIWSAGPPRPPPFYVLGYLRADSLLEDRQPEKQGPGSDVRLGFPWHIPCSTS